MQQPVTDTSSPIRSVELGPRAPRIRSLYSYDYNTITDARPGQVEGRVRDTESLLPPICLGSGLSAEHSAPDRFLQRSFTYSLCPLLIRCSLAVPNTSRSIVASIFHDLVRLEEISSLAVLVRPQ